jgi:hypothetical protein
MEIDMTTIRHFQTNLRRSARMLAPSLASMLARWCASPARALDTPFGSGGQLRIDFVGGFDSTNDVLEQRDGKIVAGGSASNGSSGAAGPVRALP